MTAGRAFAIALVLAGFALPARAADSLHTAVVHVTGQMEETRLPGFGRALEEVLVKVSGDARLIGDPRLTAIAAEAAGYVASFSYRDRMEDIPFHDEQGTRERPYELTVAFDATTIDGLLKNLDKMAWLDRPEVLLVATIITGGGLRYGLTADGEHGRDFREALAAEAQRTGMVVHLPSEADAAGAADLPAGTVLLRAAIAWDDAALGWRAKWEFATGAGADDAPVWEIAGVSFDGAFRNGLRGVAQVLSGNGEPVTDAQSTGQR